MTLSSAIRNRQLISFTYDGFQRTVEPHTLGIDRKGHAALRAFQVAGGSHSGEYVGWKIFHVDDLRSLAIQSQHFSGTRQGYRRGDPAFQVIHAEL